MTCAVLLFAWKDTFVRITAGYYSPVLIIWVQLVFMSLIWLPVLIFQDGWKELIPRPLRWQMLRGLSLVIGMGLFYWSVMLIPLADATAVSFVSPLVVAALSPFFLGEKIGYHRWGAICLGFTGVIILLRPVFMSDSLGYVAAFSSGFCVGIYYMTNRKLVQINASFASVVYPAYLGSIILLPLIPFNWTAPRYEDTWIIAGFLIITCIAQTMVISAFRFGQASVVAPFHYFQIVGATIFGYFIFSEFPDLMTWIGVFVVVGSGLYIAIRENKVPTKK